MIELCCCGHENDHIGKRCHHPIGNDISHMCPCPSGQRVDVAQFQATVETNTALSQLSITLMRLLAIAETTTNLQTRVVQDGERFHVEVQQKAVKPSLILPR